MSIGSTWAFLIYILVMVGGMVWRTFFAAAPYETMALYLTAGVTAYLGKRLMQKKYNSVPNKGTEIGD